MTCYGIVMAIPEDMELIGYASASAVGVPVQDQIEALSKEGGSPDRIFKDEQLVGAIPSSPGFSLVREQLSAGITLVIFRLDCLGQNLIDIVYNLKLVAETGGQLIVINDKILTHSDSISLLSAASKIADADQRLSEERDSLEKRKREEKQQTRGRKPSLEPGTPLWEEVIYWMLDGLTPVEIAKRTKGVSKSTLYNKRSELQADLESRREAAAKRKKEHLLNNRAAKNPFGFKAGPKLTDLL